jgi:nucleotide-binding universal stress UspA family protein
MSRKNLCLSLFILSLLCVSLPSFAAKAERRIDTPIKKVFVVLHSHLDIGYTGANDRLEMEHKLEAWCEEAARLSHREVEAAILSERNPASAIVRFARRGKFDLIVVATRGRTGLKHLMLGSVAERVVREAHCKVLVVRRT